MAKPSDLIGKSGAVSGSPSVSPKPAATPLPTPDPHGQPRKYGGDTQKPAKGVQKTHGGIGATPTSVRPKV